MPNPKIVVEYIAKTAGLQAAAGDVGTASGKAGTMARKAFVPAAAALGAMGVAAKKAVDSASSLNEQMSASKMVFGTHAKGVQAWAKTGAQAFGLSSTEALKAANAYGNMFTTVGLGERDVTKMSKSMVQLAGDMASFHDQDPTEMLEKLQSGLSGEAEPLRKFGVLISEASVKAEAYRTGIAKHGATLTEAQKVQARYSLILAQTGKAQGDFARTGDSVANQQRTLAAETENTSAAFGQALLPAMQAVQKIASALIGVFGGNVTALTVVIATIAAGAAAIVAINAAMAAWATITKVVTALSKAQAAAQLALNVVMAANPIMLVVVALAALVAAFIIAYKTSDTFRKIVDGAFDAVVTSAKAAINWIKANWPLLLAVLVGPFGLAVLAIVKNFDKIEAGARGAISAIKDAFNGLVSFLGGLINKIENAASNIANAFKRPINAVINAWNGLSFRIPAIKIPSIKIGKKKIGGGGFGGTTINFPNVPTLAAGGIVTAPTLALIGEQGPEAVVPLGDMTQPRVEVRVFIGQTELTDLVRTEIVDANTGIARALLAGGSA